MRPRACARLHLDRAPPSAARVRAGYISTVHLLPSDEVAAGVARLEAEAAEGRPELPTRLDWRLLVASQVIVHRA